MVNPLKPYIYGAIALVALSGWAFGGWQTIRYVSEQRDHQATKGQVAVDASTAANATIDGLQAAHAEEVQSLLDQLKQQQTATSAARAENNRLMAKLGGFQRALEAITDEQTLAYLSVLVPDPVRFSMRDAQHSHETEGN